MSIRVKKIGYDANNPIFVKLNMMKLEAIQKQLGKKLVAEVGIMGSNVARQAVKTTAKGNRIADKKKASPLTNAEVGLKHEKGSLSENIPRRSFLEMPLKDKLPGAMGKIGGILLVGIEATNILMVYQKLGLVAEGIVLGAFNSSGYGQWPPNAPLTIKIKGSSRPLIDTAQLRKSITSRVATK